MAAWELHVQSLRDEVTLQVTAGMGRAKLAKEIERELGIAADGQLWIVDDKELQGDLEPGTSKLMVLHGQPLKALPQRFELRFTSARERLGPRYSSGFIIEYRLRGDLAQGEMVLEPWRKNDHDKLRYKSDGTVTRLSCHWMAGQRETTEELSTDPLADFMMRWRGRYLPADAARFWKVGDWEEAVDKAKDHLMSSTEGPQSVPNYDAVAGWFLAPEDCNEIEVDFWLDGKQVRRMLLDSEGKVLRAAIVGCRVGPLHEDIEEYDVELAEVELGKSLESDGWLS